MKLQFFEPIEHDLICGVTPITTRFGARCTFTLPGTVINREFSISDRAGGCRSTETLQLYLEFLQILIKLDYRTKDDLHICFSNFDVFFEKYLVPLYKLRGSFIHGYRENLIIDSMGIGACLVRRIDDSFNQLSVTELILDQFAEQVFLNMEQLTVDLLACLTYLEPI